MRITVDLNDSVICDLMKITGEKMKSPAQTLLELSGSWNDTKKADDIIHEIKKNRINSKKLNKGF